MIERFQNPPPFKRENWARMTLDAFSDDKRLKDYYLQCIAAIHAGGRASEYGMRFMMWMLDSRLPDMTRSVDQAVIDKLRPRQFTKPMLREALTRVLTMDLGAAFTNGAAAFEFLVIAGDLATFLAKEIGATAEFEEALASVASMALLTFIAEINIELGITPASSWQSFAAGKHPPTSHR